MLSGVVSEMTASRVALRASMKKREANETYKEGTISILFNILSA